jgi:hypothetical protein
MIRNFLSNHPQKNRVEMGAYPPEKTLTKNRMLNQVSRFRFTRIVLMIRINAGGAKNPEKKRNRNAKVKGNSNDLLVISKT